MKKLSHLGSAKETYIEHMIHALRYAGKLAYASISVIIHAAYPQWHQNTASNIAKEIAESVKQRHSK
jgi:hypothetical protein